MAVSLWPLSLAAVGGVLLWSGVQDPDGGPVGAVRTLLAGQTPVPRARPSGDAKDGKAPDVKSPYADKPLSYSGGGSTGAGARVVATAQTYLGAPYRLGGTTKSGIDCSGLVKVAYAAVGVSMAHDATSQTRKGKIIPRASAAPGDLVAWGSPIRYPHIALVVDSTRCIGAWTYGTPCGYGRIDQRMYNGGPTIFRVPVGASV
jgi:cell wall-associated NlpC family hydrolase